MPNSISENLNRLQIAKEDIADAITENGGIIEQNDGLEEYPTRITNRFTEVNDTLSILLKGPTLITKSIIQNGTYSAEDDNADGYSEVTVTVPNSYSVADEGKVVSNGQLIAQTAHATITANGTYDTTVNNSVVVNIPEGGKIVPLTVPGYTGTQINFLVYDSTNIFITGTLQNGNLNRTVIFEYTDNITPPSTTFNNVVMLGDGTKYTSCSINTLNKQITMQIYSFSGSAGGVYYFSPIAAN